MRRSPRTFSDSRTLSEVGPLSSDDDPWDPATAADGVPESSIVGVEGPLWAETLANINDCEYLAFPRLAALAEVAWSPQAARTWDDFAFALVHKGPRWTALGLNFSRAPAVPWGS